MRLPSCTTRAFSQPIPLRGCAQRRGLLTLAIETSCDDTGVALLEKHQNGSATLHFHERITADNRAYRGVYPISTANSHQKNLATLVKKALQSLPIAKVSSSKNGLIVKSDGKDELRHKPNFVAATRGPGMRASLTTGLDTAKGLSVAWQIPFLGIHHMQAHALTPRLVSALDAFEAGAEIQKETHPRFPYLSLLVSGGNTMLVHSNDLCNHKVIAQTADLAVGDAIDKCARDILPEKIIESSPDVSYGPSLERYAFPESSFESIDNGYAYTIPGQGSSFDTNSPLENSDNLITWSLPTPYSKKGKDGNPDIFSFSGIGSAVKRVAAANPDMKDAERQLLAREAMRVAFEHLASRVVIALKGPAEGIDTLVVAGGVASNQYLKYILRKALDANGYGDMKLIFPPPKFCTDNAAMIAWTGIEMWEAGYRTQLSAMALKDWSLDPSSNDGGILGPPEWIYGDGVSFQN
ncbi:glycoprotease family-domain-containing protein [Bisporella sp. PMI_857]|nr:glycoprotease family-domain-containing protein [Bisporella sp. PMI_857]